MPVELFLRGDQIATYQGLTSGGNSNGVRVQLTGVQPLGTADQIFRVVVRQDNPNDPFFNNGQFVDIYAWPDSDPSGPPLFSNLNPQHDQFQGRASSGTHEIFTNPANVVFQTNPIAPGTLQYGPGYNPPRAERLPFNAFPDEPPMVPCFVAGTLIDTAQGPLRVERLRPGDRIITYDGGMQRLAWVGRRRVDGIGRLAPICISAGALGNQRDLWVSPQHRLLIRDWRAEMLFGVPEVLVAAQHLVNGTDITQCPRERITYVHLLFDSHRIVYSEGIPSESLHPGHLAMGAFGAVARAEVLELFPDLASVEPEARGDRRKLAKREAEAFVAALAEDVR